MRAFRTFVFAALLAAAAVPSAFPGDHPHDNLIRYDGPATCLPCHPDAAREVAESLHYQLQAVPQFLDAWPEGASAGMASVYRAPAGTTAARNWIGILRPGDAAKPELPAGCVLCHPGHGEKPGVFGSVSEADARNVDCLLCHAPGYRRIVVRTDAGMRLAPDPAVDVAKAVRGVRKATNDMCFRCHLGAGIGPDHRHGIVPTPESDVHLARGLACTRCHTVRRHKIGGGGDLMAQEMTEVRVACGACHEIHKGPKAEIIERHVARLACQTCHIPVVAADPKVQAVVARDWTKTVRDDRTGLYGPADRTGARLRPVYRWWNRTMKATGEPVGAIGDDLSKIFPWKRTDYTVIVDAASGAPIPFSSAVYAVTGDPGAAAKRGAQDAGQAYGGSWKGVDRAMFFSLSHQVAPKEATLACRACHAPDGVIDFGALGYSPERVKELRRLLD